MKVSMWWEHHLWQFSAEMGFRNPKKQIKDLFLEEFWNPKDTIFLLLLYTLNSRPSQFVRYPKTIEMHYSDTKDRNRSSLCCTFFVYQGTFETMWLPEYTHAFLSWWAEGVKVLSPEIASEGCCPSSACSPLFFLPLCLSWHSQEVEAKSDQENGVLLKLPASHCWN